MPQNGPIQNSNHHLPMQRSPVTVQKPVQNTSVTDSVPLQIRCPAVGLGHEECTENRSNKSKVDRIVRESFALTESKWLHVSASKCQSKASLTKSDGFTLLPLLTLLRVSGCPSPTFHSSPEWSPPC